MTGLADYNVLLKNGFDSTWFDVSDMDVSLCAYNSICRREDSESFQVWLLFCQDPEGNSKMKSKDSFKYKP